MTLPATDSFTGSDYAELDTYSANWTQTGSYRMGIWSNAYVGWDSSQGAAYLWNADTFANDQYAKCTIVAVTTPQTIGVGVRLNATNGGNGYYAFGETGGTYIGSISNGTFSDLFSVSGTDVSDVYELRAVGTTISFYFNDVFQDSTTDSAHSSGAAGVTAWADSHSASADNWEGGNYSTAQQIDKSEGVTVGESQTVQLANALVISTTDAITVGEASSVSAGAPPTIIISASEDTTIGESSALLLSTATINVSDGTAVGEAAGASMPGLPARTVNVTDDVGVYDPPFNGAVTTDIPVTDAITLGESVAVGLANALGATVTDDAAVGESTSVSLAGAAAQTINVTDEAVIGETSSLIELLPGINVTDDAVTGETIITAEGAIVINVDDPATIGEAVLAALTTLAAQATDDIVTADVPGVTVQEPPLPALSINVSPDNHAYWIHGVKVQQ